MAVLRIFVSVLYAIAGVSVFGAFIWLKNYPTAVLGISTGILNILLTHLHVLNHKNTLLNWYSKEHLIQISRFGFCSFALSTMLFVYFTTTEIILGTPMLPIADSIVLCIVWSFMTMKSGIFVMSYAYSYSQQNESLLTEEADEDEQ